MKSVYVKYRVVSADGKGSIQEIEIPVTPEVAAELLAHMRHDAAIARSDTRHSPKHPPTKQQLYRAMGYAEDTADIALRLIQSQKI